MWVPAAEMVGLGRFELPTSPLSGVRSNQLSYRPKLDKLAGSPAGSDLARARRLSQNLIQFKRVSRTRLNMLGGYAAHDHRANGRSSKEGLYQDSRACRQGRRLQVRWTLHHSADLATLRYSRKG